MDPSAFPEFISMWELYGKTVQDHVFYLNRTYVYYLHREKQIMAGNWTGDMSITRLPRPADKKGKNKTNTNLSSFSGQHHQSSLPGPAIPYSQLVSTDASGPMNLSVHNQPIEKAPPMYAADAGHQARTSMGQVAGCSGVSDQSIFLDCLGGSDVCSLEVVGAVIGYGSQSSSSGPQYKTTPCTVVKRTRAQ